jgi:hypothetical protein
MSHSSTAIVRTVLLELEIAGRWSVTAAYLYRSCTMRYDSCRQRIIPKSRNQFSEKIMRKQWERFLCSPAALPH